jgi:hypothetical protein
MLGVSPARSRDQAGVPGRTAAASTSGHEPRPPDRSRGRAFLCAPGSPLAGGDRVGARGEGLGDRPHGGIHRRVELGLLLWPQHSDNLLVVRLAIPTWPFAMQSKGSIQDSRLKYLLLNGNRSSAAAVRDVHIVATLGKGSSLPNQQWRVRPPGRAETVYLKASPLSHHRRRYG